MEPPNGAQQLRLIHGRGPNEDPLTGHRLCAKAIVQPRRYLALALDEDREPWHSWCSVPPSHEKTTESARYEAGSLNDGSAGSVTS